MIQVGYTFQNESVSRVEASIIVPPSPPKPDKNDQLFYWIGAFSCNKMFLAQPVLAWNYPDYPLQWVAFAMLASLNGKYFRGDVISVNTNDLMNMKIEIIFNGYLDIRINVNGKVSNITDGGCCYLFCTVNAVLEHGNHAIDPSTTDCTVYPDNPVIFRNWFAIGDKKTIPNKLQTIYYNNNNLPCQLKSYDNKVNTNFDIFMSAGVFCNGEKYDGKCCGSEPLPKCSRDSTSCWLNPDSCRDEKNDICCFEK